jgi:ribosome-binding factor A
MNLRKLRIGDQIKRAVTHHLLTTISDPRVRDIVVTDVSLSADLKIANLFYHHLTDDLSQNERLEKIERGLRSISSFLKKAVSRDLNLKHVPEFTWLYDKSIDEGRKIDQILETINLPK